jgi:nucleoside-diphosphate-sugar epimerase
LDEKVLVTGATGFVGSHLVRRLHEKGYQVRGFVRRASDISKVADLGIEILAGDAFDIKSLDAATDDVNVIFNTIGGGHISTRSNRGGAQLRDMNVLSLKNLLDVVKHKQITKFIHFSSLNAMGFQKDIMLTENHACVARSTHELVKRESEKLAAKYHQEYGVPIVILRPPQIYGPGDIRSENLKMARLVKWHLFPLIDGGENYLPLVYIDDVVECAIRAVQLGGTGETYIVSDRSSYKLKDIIGEIAKNIPTRHPSIYVPKSVASVLVRLVEASSLLGIEPFFTSHRIETSTSNRFVSIEKAKNELGYEPKTDLEAGMKRTIEWYKQEGFL